MWLWFFYLVAIVIGLFLFLLYCVFVVPLAALVTACAYAAGLPIAYLTAMGTVLGMRPDTLAPPARWPPAREKTEPAVLGYFHGPAVADAEHTVRTAIVLCRQLWQKGGLRLRAAFESGELVVLTGPIGIGGAFGLVAGTAIGMVCFACCAAVHLAVAGLALAAVRITASVLRAVDSAWLRVRNIRMICPHCFQKVTYPAYGCSGPACSRRHRDIRPGRYGVVRRWCRCGARLPTLLLFGSGEMAAYCPREGCDKPLEHGPGAAPEIVLPLFGAAGAGKTRLLYGMVVQLRAWSEQGLLKAEPADAFTARDLRLVDRFLAPGRATPKTVVGLPRSLVIRLVTEGRTRVLHMFDAAGEMFYRNDRTQELGYLDKARTFLLVIDPLSVPAFWENLPSARRAALEKKRSTAPAPDLAYQQTQQEIERMGVDLGTCRLAVVFSRSDLLDGPDDGPAAEAWAGTELGLGNLVRSTTQTFRQVRFFRTAAVFTEDGTVDPSVAALMHWLLEPDGVRLPPAVDVPGVTS
jgi:Double-GTPase 2